MYHRRSIRWQDYDYTGNGAYFITICTHAKIHLFGDIDHGVMTLNAWGQIVNECWIAIPEHFPITSLDAFVVMPNHMHRVIIIDDINQVAKSTPSQKRQFAKPIAQSLPTIIGSFKSAATKRINQLREDASLPVWQRNYHEHIIRSHERYEMISAYIQTNAQRWSEDSLYTKQ